MGTKYKKLETTFRQGDVFIRRLKDGETVSSGEEIPSDRGHTILAYGEVTGHAHAIPKEHAKQFATDIINQTLLEVKQETNLRHGTLGQDDWEHFDVVLPKGKYVVKGQVEYRGRRVVD